MKEVELAILVVSYNVSIYLEKCLRSIKKNLAGIPYKLVVIDNASKDDSVSVAKNILPESIIIETGRNIGYARAMNIGAKTIFAKRYLILNPDTEITSNDIIYKMIIHMQENPNVGVVGCRMINENGGIQNFIYSFPGVFQTVSSIIQIKKILNIKYLKYCIKCFIWISCVKEYLNPQKTLLSYKEVEVVPGSCFLIDVHDF